MEKIIYPRTRDPQTVYLNAVVSGANIEIGDYTMYNDFVHDPRDFEKNNVLYHYPVNGDKLKIGKFCSIACGAKFLFTSANHTMRSLSTVGAGRQGYPLCMGQQRRHRRRQRRLDRV